MKRIWQRRGARTVPNANVYIMKPKNIISSLAASTSYLIHYQTGIALQQANSLLLSTTYVNTFPTPQPHKESYFSLSLLWKHSFLWIIYVIWNQYPNQKNYFQWDKWVNQREWSYKIGRNWDLMVIKTWLYDCPGSQELRLRSRALENVRRECFWTIRTSVFRTRNFNQHLKQGVVTINHKFRTWMLTWMNLQHATNIP